MIYVPASIGELIDKLSILHVKKIRITNSEKLEYVSKEFELLYGLSEVYLQNAEVELLYNSLVDVNVKLWDVEDDIRQHELEKKFNESFIDLARKVYYTNDERFRLKNEINLITQSEIREVKDYKPY